MKDVLTELITGTSKFRIPARVSAAEILPGDTIFERFTEVPVLVLAVQNNPKPKNNQRFDVYPYVLLTVLRRGGHIETLSEYSQWNRDRTDREFLPRDIRLIARAGMSTLELKRDVKKHRDERIARALKK